MPKVHPFCAAVLCMLAACAPAWGQDAPPPAPSAPVTDVHHGVPVPDPYRNLENLADPATRAWLQAQGQFAAAKLARIDVRDAMGRRLEELNRTTGDNVRAIRRMPGGRVYYLTRRSASLSSSSAPRETLDWRGRPGRPWQGVARAHRVSGRQHQPLRAVMGRRRRRAIGSSSGGPEKTRRLPAGRSAKGRRAGQAYSARRRGPALVPTAAVTWPITSRATWAGDVRRP